MIFLKLFLTFFKIGAFTFGGGYAMLPFIQEEVLKNAWALEEALINFIAVSESTPGPFAINMATYIGSVQGGILGAACATLGVVVPSFVIILIVAKCFDKFKESKIVQWCMVGLKSAVIGLISAAILSMAETVFLPEGIKGFEFNSSFVVSAIIFITMLTLAMKKVHPILIVCISAVCGILTGYLL